MAVEIYLSLRRIRIMDRLYLADIFVDNSFVKREQFNEEHDLSGQRIHTASAVPNSIANSVALFLTNRGLPGRIQVENGTIYDPETNELVDTVGWEDWKVEKFAQRFRQSYDYHSRKGRR